MISLEYIVTAVACGVGCAVGTYMAARRNAPALRMDDFQPITAPPSLEEIADANTAWLQLAAGAMRAQIADGTRDTGEGFRRRLVEAGLPQPRHPNSWGALSRAMTQRGVLVPTGEYQAMTDERSHGRKTPVYLKRSPEVAA